MVESQFYQYKVIVALFGDDNDPLSHLEHMSEPCCDRSRSDLYTCPAQKPLTLNECLEFRISTDKWMRQMLMASAHLKVNGERINSCTHEIPEVFAFIEQSNRAWGFTVMLEM